MAGKKQSAASLEDKNAGSPISTAGPLVSFTIHHYRLVMTGLEAIGALASIAQVGQYTISIVASLVRVYGTLEAAPGKLRLGCKQLDELSETVMLIQHNNALQTKNVLAHAHALAEQIVVLDQMLKSMLVHTKQSRFRRVARAYLGNQSEAKVAEAFAQIEMKKGALGLSVLEVNMRMTSTILNKVDAFQKPNPDRSTPVSPTDSDISGSTFAESEPDDNSFTQRQPYYHVYRNIVSSEDAFQMNGDIGQPKGFGLKNHYTHITASGNSIQLNGHISATQLDSFISSYRNKK